MPRCPSCTTEYEGEVEGVAECAICNRRLCRACRRGEARTPLCAEHADIPVIQGWVQVYSTASEFEGQLLRDNLVAEGLDAQLFSQKDNMFSVDLGELSIVRLLVPAWQYEQARDVIRDHMDGEGEVAFACPKCGEAYEPGAANCAACGAALAPDISD